eukprot:gene17390-23692_t
MLLDERRMLKPPNICVRTFPRYARRITMMIARDLNTASDELIMPDEVRECLDRAVAPQLSRNIQSVVRSTITLVKPVPMQPPTSRSVACAAGQYSTPDQQARFAAAKKENNPRVLDIEAVYDPSGVKGKTVMVTGGNRGLGLGIVEELLAQGSKVIVTTRKPTEIPGVYKVISGVEATDDKVGDVLCKGLDSDKVDILINSAGYFYEKEEKIESMNFEEQIKMINICACGPLRVTAALVNGGCLADGAKVVVITSQGGSIDWRTTQNPEGGDYGHHMSKAAANMGAVLLSQELKPSGISVVMLHPGFNKTDMTKKYEHIWEIEGAVDPCVGAKRVVHEISAITMETTGKFINCEDGLEIPW